MLTHFLELACHFILVKQGKYSSIKRQIPPVKILFDPQKYKKNTESQNLNGKHFLKYENQARLPLKTSPTIVFLKKIKYLTIFPSSSSMRIVIRQAEFVIKNCI